MRLGPAQIRVIKAGWLTTVQDLGRWGFQQYGVPVCGAMDRWSYVVGNRLVGNTDRDAALEITLKGPELLFERETVISLTGADLTPSLDGTNIPLWTSLPVPAGSRLTFGPRCTGCRCYLAIAGGVDAPIVLGSRSTHTRSETGGFHGRQLAVADILLGGDPPRRARATIGRSLPVPLRPICPDTSTGDERNVATLRVLPGPQSSCFSEQAFSVLTASVYRLSGQSDRMGYRLVGPRLVHRGSERFISDGTAMGALQVPPDGQPILLMADRQTTGGYPKIASVISADLPLAGQLAPGDAVAFKETSLAEAQAAFKEQWSVLDDAFPPVRRSRKSLHEKK